MDAVNVPTRDVVHDMNKMDSYLADLHRRVAGIEGSGAYIPFSRTLLLNLIVFVSRTEEMAQIASSVGQIMGSHPCRAILVDLSGRSEDQAPASISAVCGITERGDRRLCGEIIEVHPESPEHDLIGMVMPLLVPDAPVFFWVTGGVPCGGESFDEILHVTDYVIVDSRSFADLRENLGQLLNKCVESSFDKTLQDLAWVSLLAWRDLTAQHFDPAPTREYLLGIERVSIRYTRDGDHQGFSTVPLLFASWFIERTGIRVNSVCRDGSGAWRITGRQGDHSVFIDMIPEEDGEYVGRLKSVSIQARSGEESASFYIQGVSGTEVSITEECVGVCYPPLILELPAQDEARLVERALDNREPDRLFESAVRVACGIMDSVS